MIIDYRLTFKTYEKFMKEIRNFEYVCPTCGAKHSFNRHGSYLRNVSFFEYSTACSTILKILRVKCTSCNKTHAILPSDTIPYCIYSYSYIMKILFERFINNNSVLTLSTTFEISFQLIYSFVARFKMFLKDYIYIMSLLTLLKSNKETPTLSSVLIFINTEPVKSIFNEIFFNETRWMILMKKFLNIQPKPITIGCYNS